MLSVKEIKEELASISIESEETVRDFIKKYSDDGRSGVQSVLESAEKQLQRLKAERARSHALYEYERKYNVKYIAGIDEVGRGPLAGPVVTCCLILPSDRELLWLNDSKKLSPSKRDELYEMLKREAVCYSIGMADNVVIDKINILQATLTAMRDAVNGMQVTPEQLLCDAVTIPEITVPQLKIIKGDAKSASIGAASIVAKVTRDRMMEEYDKLYPGYGFAANKGYGTEEHIKALKKLGPCPIHRKSFIRSFVEA